MQPGSHRRCIGSGEERDREGGRDKSLGTRVVKEREEEKKKKRKEKETRGRQDPPFTQLVFLVAAAENVSCQDPVQGRPEQVPEY